MCVYYYCITLISRDAAAQGVTRLILLVRLCLLSYEIYIELHIETLYVRIWNYCCYCVLMLLLCVLLCAADAVLCGAAAAATALCGADTQCEASPCS